jgi:hypothetical protein
LRTLITDVVWHMSLAYSGDQFSIVLPCEENLSDVLAMFQRIESGYHVQMIETDVSAFRIVLYRQVKNLVPS